MEKNWGKAISWFQRGIFLIPAQKKTEPENKKTARFSLPQECKKKFINDTLFIAVFP